MKFTTDFHELYQRHASDIYRYVLYLCGDPMEAEDITAETFTRAFTGKVPLVTVTVKGYLFTIARNLYLEFLRRRKETTEIPQEIPDSNTNLENSLHQKSELEDLKTYLQTFPEVDRSAILLRVDGLEYQDIARALDISLASAKVKVHRLRMKLAEWRANR